MKNQDIIRALIQPQISEMLDLIRMRKNSETSVELLRECMDVSRSTADRLFNGINGKEGPSLVYRDERRTLIYAGKAYFLGISIGSRYIRIALIGLDFEPVELERFFPHVAAEKIRGFNLKESCTLSYAFEMSMNEVDKLGFIRSVVSQVVTYFVQRAESDDEFPLLGIGFGVAGPVDFDKQIWRSAPRMPELHNIEIADIVGYGNKKRIDDMGLFLSIDNNSKTAIISEYQYLLEKTNGQYAEDLALIYVGSGVGLAAVIDGMLLRGGHNMAGELGHVQLLLTKCLNDKTNHRDFNSEIVENLLTNVDNCELFLPYVLNLICCMLGTNRFIIVGHSVSTSNRLNSTHDNLTNAIMDQRMKFTVTSTQVHCIAETGRGIPYTSAIGAAMEAYFTLCNYIPQNNNSNRTNLARNILWKKAIKAK